jgi:hypothetical protein
MTYQEAKEHCAALEAAHNAACNDRAAIESTLAAEMGIEARGGALNLLVEPIRLHPSYRAAKANQDAAFKRLQEFNRAFVKAYKKEIQAERRARFASLERAG